MPTITITSFTCRNCGEANLTFARNKREAEQTIKEEGWAQDPEGRWACPDCAQGQPSQEVQAA